MVDEARSRTPAVAGRFYPASAERLRPMLEQMLVPAGAPALARLLMVPHAGYVYSGRIAGATYAQAVIPQHVLLMGPNHTGAGLPRSLYWGGAWQTPLGDVAVAQDLNECLLKHVDLQPDRAAHVSEHSIEVQLPFLKWIQPSLSVAALCFSRQSLAECLSLGESLATALDCFEHPVLIVCSTDMSHYISAERARHLDALALADVERLEPEQLYRTVVEHQISMCGFVPTTIGLVSAKRCGAGRARIIAYGNSGETSGDSARVVGYAGALVH